LLTITCECLQENVEFQPVSSNNLYFTASMAKRLTCVPRLREVESSNSWPAKSYTALQTVHHCFNIYASWYVALALCRGDGHCKLVTRFGVIRRVQWKVWGYK